MDYPSPDAIPVPQSKTPIIVIGIISLVLLIVYAIVLYVMQKKKTGPFKDYTPPDLVNGARPGGGLMTATEFAKRQAALKSALAQTK